MHSLWYIVLSDLVLTACSPVFSLVGELFI